MKKEINKGGKSPKDKKQYIYGGRWIKEMMDICKNRNDHFTNKEEVR